jgi:dephospho-CoA kinase
MSQPRPTSMGGGIVLGLIGQPCSGKSTFRRLLEELGAQSVEADSLVHRLYEQPDVKNAVRQLFGSEVFSADGEVDRARLAQIVFSDRGKLELLTQQIIFPRTGLVLAQLVRDFRSRAQPKDVLVLDAPTLVEAGRASWVDAILWVEAPWQRRLTWAQARGWDSHELARRHQALLPDEEKRKLARWIVINDGSLEQLRQKARQIWDQLMGAGSEQRPP